ncbi:MAG TPA: type II and III secretion system protein [bacterium]
MKILHRCSSGRVWILYICFHLIANLSATTAQENVPREYNPEEFISLSRDITMDAALEIINLLSTKYEDKMILDPREHKGKIGVVVDNMHWKRALEYILRSNQLKYNDRPRHYEIVELNEQKPTQALEDKINFGTREVEIKAIFFEADQQALAEVGIDWSTIKNGTVKLQIASNSAQSVGDNIFSVMGGWANGTYEITSIIKAFQSTSKGQVIATPQIRIMEGEEGKIKVGKNFFLTTRDFAGNTRYEQYESGTILTVLPKIISQGKFSFIHLEIQAEKSDILPGAVNVIKKTTEGRTQVLLLNGEETAMAGLFSNEQSNVRKGVPVLKDLPWWFFGLRYLFGYNSQLVTKKELIILIKAEIVPNLVSRLKSKILEKNYLEERKREFDQKVKSFKNK